MGLDNQPTFVNKPSKIEEFFASNLKYLAKKEAREFNVKFDVEDVTGFSNEAKDLWLTYFTYYVAADMVPSSEECQAALDGRDKIPIIGRLTKSAVNGPKTALLELQQESQDKATAYKNMLETIVIKNAMNMINNDFAIQIILGQTTPEEVITQMKDSGGFAKLYDTLAGLFGSPILIQLSANRASTIYKNNKNEDIKTLKERLKRALHQFSPTIPNDENTTTPDE